MIRAYLRGKQNKLGKQCLTMSTEKAKTIMKHIQIATTTNGRKRKTKPSKNDIFFLVEVAI